MPLTEAEKAQKRLIKANSYKGGSGGGSNDLLVGGGGLLADQEPVTFKHLKTWGRNYAVLQVRWGGVGRAFSPSFAPRRSGAFHFSVTIV